jgi:hypothetical protein
VAVVSAGIPLDSLADSMHTDADQALTILRELQAEGYAEEDEHGLWHATAQLEAMLGPDLRAIEAENAAW